jgi:hypothetical protein
VKKLFIIAIMIIIIINVCCLSTFAATKNIEEGLANLDNKMEGLLTVVYRIGYWVLLIIAFIDILSSVMSKNIKEVGKVILRYVIIYASLYLLPFLFSLVSDIF